MRIFIDIDGTLTTDGSHAGGRVRPRSINHVRRLIGDGHEVTLWSARGAEYVVGFAIDNGLGDAAMFLSKPDIYVDDHEEIRDRGHMRYIDPDTFEQASSVAELLAGDEE